MNLYFLRHGLAGDPAEWRGDDFERPLTKRGQRRLERQAKAIDKLSLDLDVIVTSPLVRAKQTAGIVAGALAAGCKLVVDARLSPGFDATRLGGMLREHRGARSLMLVGHEPSMTQTIHELIGGGKIELKKGGLAYIDLPEPSSGAGTLVWLIPPKVLLL